jgi:hypothetical protein
MLKHHIFTKPVAYWHFLAKMLTFVVQLIIAFPNCSAAAIEALCPDGANGTDTRKEPLHR